MRNAMTAFATVALATLGAACNSLPERIETLDQAREAVREIEEDPLAREVAQSRYEQARSALARAEEAYDEREDLEIIEHDAYVALRNAQIVQQQTAERRGREEIEQGEAARSEVLLQAREREAEQATELAERRAEALETREAQLEQRTREAEAATQRAEALQDKAAALEQQLADLEAEQTERGWVLTLDNVLFETDRTDLAPGADATLDRLAEFLASNAGHRIVIEGHTDSRGDASYNRDLSRERANAVRDALVQRGVDGSRIEIRALGEEFPVATNETTAGRQLNRRVEIVLSDEEGRFAGEQRTAAAEPTEQEE